jgi:hypothetical protein
LAKEDLLDLMSTHLEIMEAYIDILNDVTLEEERIGHHDYDMSLFS